MRSIFIILLLSQLHCISQEIILDEIMAGDDFIGHQPENILWSPDSKEVYFEWQAQDDAVQRHYAYNFASKNYRLLTSAELQELPVNGFYAYEKTEGGIYKNGRILYSWNAKSEIKVLIEKFDPFNIYSAKNENEFLLEEGNDIYKYSLNPFSITQITRFKDGSQPNNSAKANNFLEQQQRELFWIINEQETRNTSKSRYRDSSQQKSLTPFYLEGKSLGDRVLSPCLEFCIVRTDEYPDYDYTTYIDYITEDGYSKTNNARPKVGAPNPQHSLFVWHLKNDTIIEVNIDHLTGIKTPPEFLSLYNPDLKEYVDPKNVFYHIHGFAANDSKSALVELKSYDNKDRWICLLDTETGNLHEINHQHDEKWIGGPGISGWNMVAGNVGWISNDHVYFQSEVSGYSHLYTYNINSKSTDQLTSGQFEIHDAKLNKNKTGFYISINKSHPGNREFSFLNINTKEIEILSNLDGKHEVDISPNEKNVAFRYSYKNKPWELYVNSIKDWDYSKVTNSLTPEFSKVSWIDPEIITYKAKDGVDVNARIYEPTSNKNGAAIMFVHGAGYLQNAHNWWSGYHREYMFHNLLVEQGYTVLDIDYRASKGYGRDFRTDIYQHMGGKDLSDYIDGRQWLIDRKGIDPERIGIYGGSYGGFITLMALLTEPGKFKCGAAIRSVTDWAHYNHAYTSNILNTPEEDPEAYKRSSPIYFAENLEDRLLMLHGMMDDNVQYQDVVRLSQRFIELKKKNWHLVGYPIEPHGFIETTSWIDEYGRILEMFNEELLE